jgi:hypothetical protein
LSFEELSVGDLRVNQANDRHGEIGSEDLAIAELFRLHDVQMRNLAADIASVAAVYDPPLVMQDEDRFVVFDGNRRVTCLKLLRDPSRAPTAELRAYFEGLREGAAGVPDRLVCQIETDRNLIDGILFRRHTGSQRGVGRLDWNDRAKLNFIERTGQGNGINVAAEIERLLTEAGRLPEGNIPWSTLTRLLSSEEFRNRAGISTSGRRFRLTHDHAAVTDALHRIAGDLAGQVVTLGDLWNNEGKRTYLNRLQDEGILPAENELLPQPVESSGAVRAPRRNQPPPRPPQTTFIPADAPRIQWTAAQHRVRAVWEELQSLTLREHPNAVSALMRILVELSVESYIAEHGLVVADNLSRKVGAVATDLLQRQIIDRAYFDELERIRMADQLISVASMQRYIHSPDFAPMENELRTYWARLGRFLQATLSR